MKRKKKIRNLILFFIFFQIRVEDFKMYARGAKKRRGGSGIRKIAYCFDLYETTLNIHIYTHTHLYK